MYANENIFTNARMYADVALEYVWLTAQYESLVDKMCRKTRGGEGDKGGMFLILYYGVDVNTLCTSRHSDGHPFLRLASN